MSDNEQDDKQPARENPDWWKDRDTRRKARYAKDGDYRDKVIERSRTHYQQTMGVVIFDPRDNLPHFDRFGMMRDVTMPNGNVVRRWCMTKGEAAEVFGRAHKLFYRWVSEGRFPEAVLTALDTQHTRDFAKAKRVKWPRQVGVYTSDEIKAAVNALGPHLSRVAYYRRDHDEAREAVFEAVGKVHKSLGLPLEKPEPDTKED